MGAKAVRMRGMNALRKMWRAFARAKGGGAAIIFALALVPMVMAAGAGVDFTRALIVRSKMGAALDAAALAIGSTSGLNTEAMRATAQSFFNANYTLDSSYGATPVLTVTPSDQQIVITASASMPTFFIRLAGYDALSVANSTTVVWGQIKLWVSLVLDNTGSMRDSGKMDALKGASHSLLTMLENAADAEGDVRVAIIPFNKDVNVGSANYQSSWLKWTDWDADNGSWNNWWCSWYPVGCSWNAASHSTWNGCVTDRDQDYDTRNTTPSNNATKFPTEEYSDCPTSIQPLTYNWTTLSNKIDAMTSVGNTNQTIGLAWGWLAMTQGVPLSPPALPENTNRVIILLSDGLNTQNRWSSSQSAVDARMALACTNAKADGITIYTVLVMSGNSSVLKGCASDASKYFQLTEASQITTAFTTIGQQITNLRVSQ